MKITTYILSLPFIVRFLNSHGYFSSVFIRTPHCGNNRKTHSTLFFLKDNGNDFAVDKDCCITRFCSKDNE